ncbi:flavin reductase [Kribbella caucasensis]|nr:flavin reductase [Kribbella sp. VKM Ac-2527]
MAKLPAAVNVVTTNGTHGRVGITVSAVCSVTDEPPSVIICLNKSSYTHDIFEANGRVCINVLSADDEELALHFAGVTEVPMDARFGWDRWDHHSEDVPVLRQSLVSLVGHIVQQSDCGSHSVWLVRISRVLQRGETEALVYFQRRFHRV